MRRQGINPHNGELNGMLRLVVADPAITLRSLADSGKQRSVGVKRLVQPRSVNQRKYVEAIEQHDMVAIPANRPRNMQQNLVQEAQRCGDLVRDVFGGMEVPGIERQQFLARYGIAHVVFRRAGRIAFRSDAEQLGFHRIQMPVLESPDIDDHIDLIAM